MTLLIVDGMDRCGKDSLVRGLVARRKTTKPLHTFHNVAPPKALDGKAAREYHLELYASQVEMALHYDAHDFIVNRSWLSEEVYGHMYRGQPEKLDAEWMMETSHMLQNNLHLVVTLTDTAAAVVARSDGDSTFEKQKEFVSDAIRNASIERELFLKSHARLGHYNIARINYDGRHPDLIIEDVAALLGW